MDASGVYGTFSAQDGKTVTPSDSTVFTPPFRALYVGTAGNVVITSMWGNVVTYPNVPAGTQLAAAGTKVMAATTASGIVAMI